MGGQVLPALAIGGVGALHQCADRGRHVRAADLGDRPVFRHEKLALEVPPWVSCSSRLLHELPRRACVRPIDQPLLEQNPSGRAGKIELAVRELADCRIITQFLTAKLAGWEGEDR